MRLDSWALLAAGGALLLGAFLIRQILSRSPRPSTPDALLVGLLATCALNAFHPALGLDFEPLEFLFPPLLAAYSRSLLTSDFRLHWGLLWHALPFGGALAGSIAFTVQGHPSVSVSMVLWAVLVVQMLAYLAPALHRFHSYQDHLVDQVSNLAPVDLGWLRRVFWVATGVALLAVGILVVLLHDHRPPFLAPLLSTAWALAVWVLGSRGLAQHPLLDRGPEPAAPSRPPAIADDAQLASLALRVRQRFEQAKPHLDPDLDLGTLARQLGLTRNTLSSVINGQFGVNFYEWVNGWRVAEFRALAADPKRDADKVLTLAFEAGFNSKPTFNKVVRDLTGKTPSVLRSEEIESRRTR